MKRSREQRMRDGLSRLPNGWLERRGEGPLRRHWASVAGAAAAVSFIAGYLLGIGTCIAMHWLDRLGGK